jgi:YVTN family beta-propeller protein
MAGSLLNLRYVFTPAPNPIRASVGGANPNQIDLQVMVSNPGTNPVTLQTITIQIPVGEEGAHTLSNSPNLPNPVYDSNSGWTASSSGSTVTLNLPAAGLIDSFLFTLPGIQINDTAGVVPITITETAPKVIDSTTYELVKYEADFPVSNFYAQPATLYNLDESVTLFWNCSDQGENYVYSVHSDSWQPDDCLNGGTCYTCANGQQGIVTPELNTHTTFALDVIKTNPNGSRSIYKTLYTSVQVLVPSVSTSSYLEALSFTGYIVRLHWLAYNAAYCTVAMDGNVIVSHAPTDTYQQGYQLILFGQEGSHQLVVTAHAESGPAQSTFLFPNVYTRQVSIPVGAGPQSVAFTPDSKLGLVTNLFDENVTVIDLATFHTRGTPVPVGPISGSIAVTPDGKLALVPSAGNGTVTVIDLATMQAEPNAIQVSSSLVAIAITPDGTLALVADFNNNLVAVIDIASRQSEAKKIGVGTSPTAIAITPDGKRALVVNQNSGDVSVIDIASRSAQSNTISAGNRPVAIAITPDGTLALIPNSDDGSVTVIDLATLQAEPNAIQVGGSPTAIAITPDGVFALVADDAGNGLLIIDVAGRSVIGQPIPAGKRPQDVAVAPDGSVTLTTNSGSNDVTVI